MLPRSTLASPKTPADPPPPQPPHHAPPPASPSIQRAKAALRLHDRLHRWRRRERTRRPGLFADALTPRPERPSAVSLQTLLNGRARVLVDGAPVLICDACGALLPAAEAPAASSASTLPPSAPADEPWAACPACAFVTPVGPLRRLLHLPDDRGPHLPPAAARALLVEAVSDCAALASPARRRRFLDATDEEPVVSWLRDRESRHAGLDDLCGVLGLREEQLVDGATVAAERGVDLHGLVETEAFLALSVPSGVMPRLPFSVAQLCGESSAEPGAKERALKAREASERAKLIVMDAVRIWRNEKVGSGMEGTDTTVAIALKLRALGREYHLEQTRSRIYNHSELRVPEQMQATQPQRGLSDLDKSDGLPGENNQDTAVRAHPQLHA